MIRILSTMGRMVLTGSLVGTLLAATATVGSADIDESGSIYATRPIRVPDFGREWRGIDARKSRVISLTDGARRGDAAAASELGQMYLNGECVTRDPLEARRWLQIAAAKEDVTALKLLAGMEDEGAGGLYDPAGSMRDLERAAARGDAEAMLSLGMAYLRGDRVPRNAALATRWMERAKSVAGSRQQEIADQVDLSLAELAQAQGHWLVARTHFLAILARHDWLKRLDEDLADPSAHRAEEAASSRAMLEIGRCYELGIGVPADQHQAIRWYRAASLGAEEKLASTKLASILGAWQQNGWGKRPFNLLALQELFQGNTGGNGFFPNAQALDLIFPPNHQVAAPARKTVDALLAKARAGDLESAYYAGWMALHGWGLRRDPRAARAWFERASGYDNAAMILGTMAMQGLGGPVDLRAARRWFGQALCDQAGYIQSTMFYQTFVTNDGKALVPDFFAKLDRLTRAAEAGDPKAQLWRARQYSRGLGVMPDLSEAVDWYGRAARQGQANALYELAKLYEFGTGVAADRDQWLRLLRKAAARGQAMAASDLATAHAPTSGWDAPKSEAQEMRWYLRAAELGMPGEMGEVVRLLDRAQRYADIARWREMEADQGVPSASTELAALYRLGQGVPRDLAKARALFEASLKTAQPAFYPLGLMLELGEGGPVDLLRAIALYHKADNQWANYRLGLMSEEGRGLARNDRAARRYYQAVIEGETAEGGPDASVTHEARYRLGRLLEAGRGGPRDLKAAVAEYQASESSHAVARLGEILAGGMLGKPDPDAAAKAYDEFFRINDLWHAPDLDFLDGTLRTECLGEDVATLASLLEQAAPGDPEAACLLGRLYERGVGMPGVIACARDLYASAARRGSGEGYYRWALLEQSGALGDAEQRASAAHFRDAVVTARSRYEVETFGAGESAGYLEALRWLPKVRDDVSFQEDRRRDFTTQLTAVVLGGRANWRDLLTAAEDDARFNGRAFDFWLMSLSSLGSLDATALTELSSKAASGSLPARLLLVFHEAAIGDRARFACDYPILLAAAKQGDLRAQVSTGVLLLAGQLPQADRVEAAAWLEVAASQGDFLAVRELAALHGRLDADERAAADAKAVAWWRLHRRTLL